MPYTNVCPFEKSGPLYVGLEVSSTKEPIQWCEVQEKERASKTHNPVGLRSSEILKIVS
jgi:hypothetical protein